MRALLDETPRPSLAVLARQHGALESALGLGLGLDASHRRLVRSPLYFDAL